MDNFLVVIIIILSHFPVAISWWQHLKKGEIPSASDFGGAGIILYYDFGLVLEVFNFSYASQYFSPFFSASESDQFTGMTFIIIAPWLFYLGSFISSHGVAPLRGGQNTRILKVRRKEFYLFAILVTLPLLFWGYKQIVRDVPLWVTRQDTANTWGPLIVLLFLPLHFSIFYMLQLDSHSKGGFLFLMFLMVAASVVTIPIGQRLYVLLPWLAFLVFSTRFSVAKVLGFGVAGLIIASTVLPLFRYGFAESRLNVDLELIQQTISVDIMRGPLLMDVVGRSDFIGTHVMPYSFSGYVYSAVFFLPRKLVPIKGFSTANYLTASITNLNVDRIKWGFGGGVIEELALNGGLVAVPFGLIIYGIIMGIFDRICLKYPAMIVPTRLGAIWACGYHLPAVLLIFGSMVPMIWLLSNFFVDKDSVPQAVA